MDISAKFIGQIAGFIAVIQVIPYFISIFKGDTKPERTTFAIWSLVNIVTVSSYIAVGATTTIFVPLIFAMTSVIIFLLSLKYGMGGFNRLDIACLCISLVAIAIWVITSNPLLALYGNLIASTLGFLPTIKKVYYLPKTENTLSWTLSALASVLNLFAITSTKAGIIILPLMSALGGVTVALMLNFPNRRLARYPVNNLKKLKRPPVKHARKL